MGKDKARSSKKTSEKSSSLQNSNSESNSEMQRLLKVEQAIELIESDAPLRKLATKVVGLDEDTMQTLRQSKEVKTALKGRDDGNALMAVLLTGSVEYALPHQSDFGEAKDRGEDLHDEGKPTMNCWQFAQHADLLSGDTTEKELQDFHERTKGETKWWKQGQALTGDGFSLYEPGEQEPDSGDCVLVVSVKLDEDTEDGWRTTGRMPDHVMVSLGGSKVMSHDGGSGDVANLEDLRAWYKRFDNAYDVKVEDFVKMEKQHGKEVGKGYREMKGGYSRQVLLFGTAPWKTEEIGL